MKHPFILGLDVGQADDPTAIGVVHVVDEVRKRGPPVTMFNVRYLKRLELGTPYPDVVDTVTEMLERKPLLDSTDLVVDATGVGRPIVDMFRKQGLKPIAVSITGGEQESTTEWGWHVPKRNLVMDTNLLLQTGHLQFAAGIEDLDAFKSELQNFKVKIDPLTAHDSYEAARSGLHDDLVICVALACWRGLKFKPRTHLKAVEPEPAKVVLPGFEPDWDAKYQKMLSKKLAREAGLKSRRTW